MGVVPFLVWGFHICELQEDSVWGAHLPMWGWAVWGEEYPHGKSNTWFCPQNVLFSWIKGPKHFNFANQWLSWSHHQTWLNELATNFAVVAPSVAGCRAGSQPGHDTSPGDGAAAAVSHVSWGSAALQVGQHDGRLLGGHSPQSHPEDIRWQGPRHHRRAEQKPGCVCANSAEKVLSLSVNSHPSVNMFSNGWLIASFVSPSG